MDRGTYTVLLERRAEREFRKLPSDVMTRLDAVFRGLAANPRPGGVVKLSGQTGPGWRVRVGEYRVLYRVDDDQRGLKYTASSIAEKPIGHKIALDDAYCMGAYLAAPSFFHPSDLIFQAPYRHLLCFSRKPLQ